MADVYITKQDDMIDEICFRKYGATSPYTEAVLAANPGVAKLCPFLPAGVSIVLPDVPPQDVQSVAVWD